MIPSFSKMFDESKDDDEEEEKLEDESCKEKVFNDIGGVKIIIDDVTKKRRSNIKEIKLAIDILQNIKDIENKLTLSRTTSGSFHYCPEKSMVIFYPGGIGFGQHLAVSFLKKLRNEYNSIVGNCV
jgi:hypothetical protein